MSNSQPLPDGRFRIGAVSKITGIPVSTLRIWETRYGAFRPVKSQGQQRLYAEHDVSKALLIKQLTQSGHAIGTVAHLDGDSLRSLLSQNQPLMSSRPTGEPVAMAVVGLTLANRLESKTFTQAQPERLFQITDVWKISTQFTLETGFIYEASTIKQTGDEQKEREFSYPKPRATLTWQATEADQVRTSITRDVAQLDFVEAVAHEAMRLKPVAPMMPALGSALVVIGA